MSRHKLVRNLDLDAELDDYDANDYDDDEDDGMTEAERQQMKAGIKKVHDILGPIPGLKDSDIEESLWYYYFDVEKTVNYILNQQAKANKPKPKPKSKQQPIQPQRQTAAAVSQLEKGDVGQGLGYDFGSRTAVEMGFFLDAPWGKVPPERLGCLLSQPFPVKLGLLGGSGAPKMSKLAALAKARKEKKLAEEAGAAVAAAENSASVAKERASISLLSRLSHKSPVTSPAISTPSHTSNSRAGTTSPMSTTKGHKLEKSPQENNNRLQGLDQPQSAAVEEERNDRKAFREDLSLKAVPSSFAASMFGPRLVYEAEFLWADTKTFDVLTGKEAVKVKKGFSGPSPDDVVETAQKGMGGAKGKAGDRNGETTSKGSLNEGLKGLSIDLAPSPTPSKQKIDVLKAYRESSEKYHVNFVVVGHVDAGKSTLMGRLLYDTGAVDERTLQKFRKEAERIGKGSFALAWVLDQTQEERSRGVTVDVAVNKFETEKTVFTILDAPGHKDFVPNMIAGAARADFAILVIDASTGAFEAGFHLRGQTKEHTLLVRSTGVHRVVVAVNKLDSVDWDKARFDEIKQQMSQFLSNAGFHERDVSFIPCSGLEGTNVIKEPETGVIPWYTGPTLLEELDTTTEYSRAIEKPLRLTVSDIYKGGAQNHLTVSGRIESGYVQETDVLLTVPNKEQVTIKSILVNDEPRQWAVAGHNVSLQLTGFDQLHLRPGDLLCHTTSPVVPLRCFQLKLLAFETLTPMAVDIHRGQLHAPGRIATMLQTYDKSNGTVIKKKPRHIAAGSLASVKIELAGGESIPVEVGNKIVLRSNGQTVAAGIVEK